MTIVKKIDDLGRFSIPRDIRRELGIMPGDEVDLIYDSNGYIKIIKHQNTDEINEIIEQFEDFINLHKDEPNIINKLKNLIS